MTEWLVRSRSESHVLQPDAMLDHGSGYANAGSPNFTRRRQRLRVELMASWRRPDQHPLGGALIVLDTLLLCPRGSVILPAARDSRCRDLGVASPTAREPLLPMPRRTHHSQVDGWGS